MHQCGKDWSWKGRDGVEVKVTPGRGFREGGVPLKGFSLILVPLAPPSWAMWQKGLKVTAKESKFSFLSQPGERWGEE